MNNPTDADVLKLAKKTTQGDWDNDHVTDSVYAETNFGCTSVLVAHCKHVRDAAYIAAANPAYVIDLIGRYALQEMQIKTLAELVGNQEQRLYALYQLYMATSTCEDSEQVDADIREFIDHNPVTDEPCVVCNKPVTGYEPVICCNGHECACMGKPIEPPVCSAGCWEELMK